MSDELFKEGGPHRIRRTGNDQYAMTISLPAGEDGRIARECVADDCSPGYFKVVGGTGIIDGQDIAYCPYCRHSAEPGEFATREQRRYAQDLVLEEATQGMERMLKNALGLGASGKRHLGGGFLNIEMSLDSSPKRPVRRPLEDEVRRDVICPHCGLDHSVYGLATWCADCGQDIFLTHVEAELAVIRVMVNDVQRRREQLGVRIAAKDLENSLEDVVSIFEAVLRIQVRRYLSERGDSADDIERFFKKLGNAFQNVTRTEQVFQDSFGVQVFAALAAEERLALEETLTKRHVITHNLGVIDRKYIEKAQTAAREGREILVSDADILIAADLSMRVFADVHRRWFAAQ